MKKNNKNQEISEHVGIPFRVCRVGNPFIVLR